MTNCTFSAYLNSTELALFTRLPILVHYLIYLPVSSVLNQTSSIRFHAFCSNKSYDVTETVTNALDDNLRLGIHVKNTLHTLSGFNLL